MKSIEFNIYFEEEIPISIVKTFFILKTTKVTVGERNKQKFTFANKMFMGIEWFLIPPTFEVQDLMKLEILIN